MSKNKLPEHFVNTVEGYVDLNMLEEAAESTMKSKRSLRNLNPKRNGTEQHGGWCPTALANVRR